MNKILTVLIGLVFIVAAQADETVIAQADAMYDREEYKKGFELIESELENPVSNNEKANLYWRLSRFQLQLAQIAETENADKKELISLYEQGIQFADTAISLQASAKAYYWRAANLGKRGNVKGVLSSLNNAGDMKDDLEKALEFDSEYAAAWHVLGVLYFKLPGRPLSFGDRNKAISFSRKAAALAEAGERKNSYYLSLAEMLYERNWNSSTRQKRIQKIKTEYQKAATAMDKAAAFEGSLNLASVPEYGSTSLKDMSDRGEAWTILEWVEEFLDNKDSLKRSDLETLAELNKFRDAWK